MAEKIIGIDLGTSNSAASVIQGGKPTLIPAAEGTTVAGKAFPSIVAFSKDGDLLVGEPARRQAVTNPDNTIREAKRKIKFKEKITNHNKFQHLFFKKLSVMLKHLLATPLTKQLSQYQHTLMIIRDKQPKMQEQLLV